MVRYKSIVLIVCIIINHLHLSYKIIFITTGGIAYSKITHYMESNA